MTRAQVATAPRTIVVELRAEEYQALEAACQGRRVTAPQLIRVVVLKLAREL
jgi:hypothetical protein